MVKERLDYFVMSANDITNFPFIVTNVIRQAKSDHDAVMMDTIHINIMEKFEMVCKELGPYQHNWYRKMTKNIQKLAAQTDKLIDGSYEMSNTDRLKEARFKGGYWTQRSRIRCLKEEDRNTHFFHVWATSRLKENKIDRLKDSNGIWMNDTKDICKVAGDYFHNLFKSSDLYNNEINMSYIQKCVTQDVNDMLAKRFTNEEILEAFNQMDLHKAPGIDGLSYIFFKENWEVVGKDVLNLCHEILDGNKDISCINEMIIVLLPKIKESVDMSNFRLISLCRVIYKIISKTLKN
ncbi:hypothetical protein CXB51_005747 [Gossypium anomalum]|uniref:Reverse transcriptase domain-containing protein n=1 Tax=Gossypium anomalum TaxID=47600 RepID=A0A8J6D5E7_9ROSI|nr:hypothetical protein CXB51_005747 [Gossypium anomalum]